MPKHGTKLLSAIEVKNYKSTTKRQKFRDGGGLFFVVEPEPSERKWWMCRLIFAGKETSFSFGDYPTISLKAARDKLSDIEKQMVNGINPSAVRKAEKDPPKPAGTFESIALEWHSKNAKYEWSAVHSKNIMDRFKRHVFPNIGTRAIEEIETFELKFFLDKILVEGHIETLNRVLDNCWQVFEYAIRVDMAKENPATRLRSKIYPKRRKKGNHFAAITDPEKFGVLLRDIDEYDGMFAVKCALQLMPMVFLRSKELRFARWEEIDFQGKIWTIPINRMKRTRIDKESFPDDVHLVPLSTQAVAILEDLHQLTGDDELVFCGLVNRTRPVTDAALTKALRRMGYDGETMQIHGFRTSARTMIRERLKIDSEWIEAQMAHTVKDPLGRAYNRTTFIDDRKTMMQAWSDYLEKLKR